MKILAFAGSNSSRSINHKLVNFAASLVENAEVQVISLRDFEAPVYGIDLEENSGFPESMVALKKLFDATDGFLISVPEHNGSMPAVFKNVVDWISRMGSKPFQGKPTLFLSATPGGRAGLSVREHLAAIMPHRGADIVGHYGVGGFAAKFENGILNDQQDADEVRQLVAALVAKVLSSETLS